MALSFGNVRQHLIALSIGAGVVWGCASNGVYNGNDWTPRGADSGSGDDPEQTDEDGGVASDAGTTSDAKTTTTTTDAGNKDSGTTTTTADAGQTVIDPYNTPVVCTSGTTVSLSKGTNMDPGRSCNGCHGSDNFAGTVYPTAHEPNNCGGVSGTTLGAKIVLTGANGSSYQMSVSSDGNFIANMSGVKLPYTVKVTAGGKERAMVMSTSNGDCNSCHTVSGASGAPGRIMLP